MLKLLLLKIVVDAWAFASGFAIGFMLAALLIAFALSYRPGPRQ